MRELKIFRPNSKWTGALLRVALTDRGNIKFSIYPQMQSDGIGIPGFSKEDGVSFIVDWRDLAEMLMVFRGECESLEDGKGILCIHKDGWSKIMLRNVIEPMHHYALDIYDSRSDVERHWDFQLSLPEALGLSLIIEGVLHHTLIGCEP